jgi:hypothetical protein
MRRSLRRCWRANLISLRHSRKFAAIDELRGQRRALVPDVGDRDDLPKGGASERADSEQPLRWRTVAANDCAIGADVDADAHRIGARQPPVE